jgi:hypothetical protein
MPLFASVIPDHSRTGGAGSGSATTERSGVIDWGAHRVAIVVLSRGARPEAPLLEGSSILVGDGIEGKEVGEVRVVLDSGAGGTRGVPRVTAFQLHPMVGRAIDRSPFDARP